MKKIYEYTNYEELLRDLKEKYGIPQYPYFKNDINYSMETRIKRGKEGLFLHHDREDTVIQLSVVDYNIMYDYPFEYHMPENLTYANYIEHLMLHVLISCSNNINDELSQETGIGGIINYFCPQINTYLSKAYQYKPEWLLTSLKIFDTEYGFDAYVKCLRYLLDNYNRLNKTPRDKLLEKLCRFDLRVAYNYELADIFKDKLKKLLL